MAPHDDARIDRHTKRVECSVCHVPTFARGAATDMVRDWSLPGIINPDTRLYEPDSELAMNVVPEYGFFNGRSRFYEFGTSAIAGANGRILMAGPVGSIADAGAKINALKHHLGRQPIDFSGRLLPLKMGIFYQTGDVATAVAQGAAAVGWTYTGHTFADTERYLGIFHEVAPKDRALTCATCHDGTRMDFNALGYAPLASRNGRPLCSSCHEAKTASFYKLHEKHVRDKGFDCSTCHTFNAAR